MIEEYASISVDDSLDLDAYAETDLSSTGPGEGGSGICNPEYADPGVELTVSNNGQEIYDSGYPHDDTQSQSFATKEYWGLAQGGDSYGADGGGYVGYASYWNGGFGLYWTFLGDVYVSTSAADGSSGIPAINSVSPDYGTIGDSGDLITITGNNLLNSNGSLPTFTVSTQGIHLQAQSDDGNGNSSSNTTLYATSSVDSGIDPTNGLFDLNNDSGQSSDQNFPDYAPDTTVTGIDPPVWTANGIPFQLTIYGSYFGSAPTVTIWPGDIVYNYQPTMSGTGTNQALTTTVTVPTSEAATQATITINPGDSHCTGSCFMEVPTQGSNSPAPPPPPKDAPIQNACVVPTSETTAAIVSGNAGTADQFSEYFQQTLSDSAGDSFFGRTAAEQTGPIGTDTCHNIDPDPRFTAFTGVTGSWWDVGSQNAGSSNGPNQWGGDEVGYISSAVNAYRAYIQAHSIPSCGFTVYQTMSLTCPNGSPTIYTTNVLNATIFTDHVVSCRREGQNNQQPVCATIYR